MKYQSDKIEEVLKSATVATSAGFSTTDWANHVFTRYGETDAVGNTSIGRLPVISIHEVTANYTFEAEPDHQGTRSSAFVIRLIVPTFINRSEERWKYLTKIREAALEVLNDSALGTTDVQTGAPIVTQCSIYQDLTVTTETSYDKNYNEGN